ncbi:Protein Aster-B [Geodia barretti]|uniref:Protein Aster-B n=1 Tax=Geodia barretti TaxID=519541 RepID=A0AA35SD06_GEOBA|nr:Protein Aster-B [Geodia barretti]
MAEKGADGEKGGGGDSGKETGSTSRSSFRSLLPQQSSKDGLPSSPSPGRNKFSAAHRSKSASQATSFIDSDSYVVVGKEHVVGENQAAAGLDSPPPPRDTASRATLGREPARDSSTDGGVRAEDATAEGDRDSAVDSDSAKDKEKKKETSRFFSPPKMRGTMFPFDQIAVPMSSHRQKNMELHRIFSSLNGSEKLIDDYSCALHRDILVHGRVYITQNWLCFYANIFTWETLLTIPFSKVTAITKERTAFVFPNAVQVTTTADKYTFSSLMSRDITYNVLFKVWQNSLLNEHLRPLELVKAARRASGDTTDVGTADELWGADDGCPSATVADSYRLMPKVTTSLPTVLPTHVEIMPSPENSPHFVASVSQPAADDDESSPLTAPDAQDHGAVDNEGNVEAVKSKEQLTLQDLPRGRHPANGHTDTQKANNKDSHMASRGGSDRQQPTSTTPMTPAAGQLPDVVSMGGESLGSFSEDFETVSFAEESGEVPCGCSEHVGRTIINDVYTADVETIFQLLFTDANFFRDFLMARNTINIDIGEWQEQTDSSKLRDLNYTVALNYSFGPKFSPTTEHQVYSSSGQPGLKHLVHTEVMNRNIPYAETFFVSCQYCMTRVAHDKMRLRITANINYRKSCWGVVKNLIEKNAGDGLRSYYNHLDSFLKEHLASHPAHCRTKHRRKRQRHGPRLRHRKTAQPAPSPPSPTHHQPTSHFGG